MLKPLMVAERPRPRWKIGLFLPALMLSLVGCSVSDDPNMWYNKVVENLSGRSDVPPSTPPGYNASISTAPSTATANVVSSAPPGTASASAAASGPASAPRILPDTELYRSEASCGGMVLGSGSPPSMAASQSVGLGMTECEGLAPATCPPAARICGSADYKLRS
jgi:hypothetical protein